MSHLSNWLSEQGERPQRDWSRLSAQQAFIATTAKFSMFSGGFGTGKTSALNCRIVGLLTMVPGNLGMLARQDGKALKQTTLLGLLEMIPKNWIQAHDAQKGMLRMRPEMGGSILVYGDLKDRGDLKNHDLGFFAIDQAEEMEWEAWEFLAGRLRRKNPIVDPESGQVQYWVVGDCPISGHRHLAIGPAAACALCQASLPEIDETEDAALERPPWEMIIYPRYGFGVCNTEDPAHWIYEKFSGLPGKAEDVSEGLQDYQAYHATTYDSLKAGFVDRDYVKSLEVTYASNPLMFERYLLGKWVVAEGLLFPMFHKDTHVYHGDQTRADGSDLLPAWLPMHEYIDPGLTATTAVGWVVVEHCTCGCGKPNYYLIDEHYVVSPVPEYHCSEIKAHRKMLGREVVSTEMDEQAFSRTNVQKLSDSAMSRIYSLAQLYIDQGIYVRRNQKDWDSGYARLTAALTPDPEHHHPITGELGAPHFLVDSQCRWFIWEISKYKWKVRRRDGHQTEEPADRDDHHMDGSISFMAGRPEHRVVEPPTVETRTVFQRSIDEELNALLEPPVLSFMEM